MSTTPTTAQPTATETTWRMFMTTPGAEGEKCVIEHMVCAPTLQIAPDGTMRAAFAPEEPVFFADDDVDPWMTVCNVTPVPAAGLVVLTTVDRGVIIMSEDEYYSQV